MATKKYKPDFKKDHFEAQYWGNQQLVCGVDEVGRGCLAGPLVAAAVILPAYATYKNLKDSKIMDKEELLRAYAWIKKNCWYTWAAIDHRAIDTLNIYYATLHAMKRAVTQLFLICPQKPSLILVDAMPLKIDEIAHPTLEVAHFCYGETKSRSIAAASILAKVERDALMQHYDAMFPGYGFSHNVGYGTKFHKAALLERGRTIVHRKSFVHEDIFTMTEDYDEQQTIW